MTQRETTAIPRQLHERGEDAKCSNMGLDSTMESGARLGHRPRRPGVRRRRPTNWCSLAFSQWRNTGCRAGAGKTTTQEERLESELELGAQGAVAGHVRTRTQHQSKQQRGAAQGQGAERGGSRWHARSGELSREPTLGEEEQPCVAEKPETKPREPPMELGRGEPGRARASRGELRPGARSRRWRSKGAARELRDAQRAGERTEMSHGWSTTGRRPRLGAWRAAKQTAEGASPDEQRELGRVAQGRCARLRRMKTTGSLLLDRMRLGNWKSRRAEISDEGEKVRLGDGRSGWICTQRGRIDKGEGTAAGEKNRTKGAAGDKPEEEDDARDGEEEYPGRLKIRTVGYFRDSNLAMNQGSNQMRLIMISCG